MKIIEIRGECVADTNEVIHALAAAHTADTRPGKGAFVDLTTMKDTGMWAAANNAGDRDTLVLGGDTRMQHRAFMHDVEAVKHRLRGTLIVSVIGGIGE